MKWYSVFTFTVSTLKVAFDSTLESFQIISLLTWEMNFLWDWFSISVWQKKWVQSRTAMDHRVNLIYYKRCFNPNKKIFSWWTKLWRQVHVEESWKLVGRVTCTGSLGKNTWSMIKKKRRKNSVSVSKLNKNIIKNGEHYLFQVQHKEFISKNHGESLLGCPVWVQWKNTLTLTM